MNELDKTDHDSLIESLRASGAEYHKDNKIRCPYHEDNNPSSSVYVDGAGNWRFKCFVCDVNYSVIDTEALRLSVSVAELLSKKKGTNIPEKRISSEKSVQRAVAKQAETYTKSQIHDKFCQYGTPTYHPFRDKHGQIVTYEVHIKTNDGKRVFPMTPVAGGYAMKNVPAPRPIYNLDILDESELVYVVEGPKDCDTMADYGFMATTSLNGAGNAHHSDWTPLKDKHVVIFPDNDPNGIEYANSVVELIRNHAKSISVLDPQHYKLGIKSDITDVVNNLKNEALSKDEIKAHIQDLTFKAEGNSHIDEYAKHLAKRLDGDYREIHTPWPIIDHDCFGPTGLEEGTVTVIAGAPGVGKTFFNLQLLIHWINTGVSCECLFLEMNKNFYIRRALAMVSGRSAYGDMNTFRDMSIQQRQDIFKTFGESVNKVLNHITLPESKDDLDYDYVTKWAESKILDGAEVLIIDPITIANTSQRPWDADASLMRKLCGLVETYNRRVILVTHPRGEIKRNTSLIDSFAGGKAFVRFASNALMMQNIGDRGNVINKDNLFMESSWNREMTIVKSREGTGVNNVIAMDFSPKTLTFHECGKLPKE